MTLVYLNGPVPTVILEGADYSHSEGVTSYESLLNMGEESRLALDPAVWVMPSIPAPEDGRTEVSRFIKIDDDDGHPFWEIVYSDVDPEFFCKLVDAERDRRIATDFEYDFGEISAILDDNSTVPAGLRSLQMSATDRANWQTADGLAVKAIISGSPNMIIPVRCSDNVNVQTTAVQVGAVLAAATMRGVALLFAGGALKSAMRADPENAAQIWADATWPS